MKILTYDIETAPKLANVWGVWQQNIAASQLLEDGYILSWAAKWLDEDEVLFDSLDQYGNHLEDEAHLAKSLHTLIEEADAVVTYNGEAFDQKVANTSFLLAGLTPPLPAKSIDLYRVVKQNFKFTSNKLDFVCQKLGLETKHNHRGFDLWKGCMEGDKDCWKEMVDYNVQDVIITEQLYDRLLPWIKGHPSRAVHSTVEDKIICNNCGSDHIVKKGIEYLKKTSYQRYKCQSCGNNMRGNDLLNTVEKRRSILHNI